MNLNYTNMEIIMPVVLGVCTIAITVCISLLVYNNLCYTKKIAIEKLK